MKKTLAAAAALAACTLAAPAAANATGNGGQPDADNKKVTLCHYDGSNNNGGSGTFSKITVSVSAFYNAGHIDHTKDIWEAFSYTTKGGDVVDVAAQGDTALLAFEDCQKPAQNEKVTKPEKVITDQCGTKDDALSVAPGRGYTVGAVAGSYPNFSATVTLDEGFEWADGTTTPITYTTTAADFPNDEDCGLPETGGAVYNTAGGAGALAGIAAIGGYLFYMGRRRRA